MDVWITATLKKIDGKPKIIISATCEVKGKHLAIEKGDIWYVEPVAKIFADKWGYDRVCIGGSVSLQDQFRVNLAATAVEAKKKYDENLDPNWKAYVDRTLKRLSYKPLIH